MSNKIDKPKQTAPQLITKMKGLSENFYYSNSQSSICFVVFHRYSSFETVHFRTALYRFAMFSFNCIVILLSVICAVYLKIN